MPPFLTYFLSLSPQHQEGTHGQPVCPQSVLFGLDSWSEEADTWGRWWSLGFSTGTSLLSLVTLNISIFFS